jgi:hypothetical protein
MLIRRRYDQAAGSCLVVQYSDTFTAVRLLTLLSLRIVFKLSIDHTLVSKGRRRAPTDCFIVFYREPPFFYPAARSKVRVPVQKYLLKIHFLKLLSLGLFQVVRWSYR